MDQYGLTVTDIWLSLQAIGRPRDYSEIEDSIEKQGLYVVRRLRKYVPANRLGELTRSLDIEIDPELIVNTHRSPEETLERQAS